MPCTASLNRLLTQEHSDTKKNSIYHPRKNYSVACPSLKVVNCVENQFVNWFILLVPLNHNPYRYTFPLVLGSINLKIGMANYFKSFFPEMQQWWMILIVLSRAATWRPDSVSVSMLHYPLESNCRSRCLVQNNNNRTNKFQQTIQQPTSPLDIFTEK